MCLSCNLMKIWLKVIYSENKAVIMFDHHGKIPKSFDMQILELIFLFDNSLPTQVGINTDQWNCCLGNMANVLCLMVDTYCKYFFRMNINKHWSWFHQNLLEHDMTLFVKIQIYFKPYNQSLFIFLVIAYFHSGN